MPNKHIKIINGRKYYYESIRKGEKVTSRYIGPVEKRVRIRKAQTPDVMDGIAPEDLVVPDDAYIG